CPPRPEMLLDAILKLHDKIQVEPLGGRIALDRAAHVQRAAIEASQGGPAAAVAPAALTAEVHR
ncbi:MAG: NADH-quinone oxidoreductase subunit B, partial [Mycobacteriales bacterium]